MIDYNEITTLHETAMQFVEQGLMVRDPGRARHFFRSAFEKERAAARLLAQAPEQEPTRSVLYRSAATLAVDCKDYTEAERLIQEGLAGRPPAEIREEFGDLKARIRAERGERGERGKSRRVESKSEKAAWRVHAKATRKT